MQSLGVYHLKIVPLWECYYGADVSCKVYLSVRQKDLQAHFQDSTREDLLCNFCINFLLKRGSLFVNNSLQGLNKTKIDVDKGWLHFREYGELGVRFRFEPVAVEAASVYEESIYLRSVDVLLRKRGKIERPSFGWSNGWFGGAARRCAQPFYNG